ncbi:hypothetical protein ES703_76178 [subsurface metagenome]
MAVRINTCAPVWPPGAFQKGGTIVAPKINPNVPGLFPPWLNPSLRFALVKYGAGIVQMSGSIAGDVHARNRFGNYIRPRTKPVNPRSDRQQEARVRLQLLAEYWHSGAMSDVERGAWDDYAAAVSTTNRLGETINLTGYNHFIRSNCSIFAAGGSLVEPGPAIESLPGADITLAVSGDNGTQLLSVAFDNARGWASETGGYLLIEMGRPQLATRNFFSNPFRIAGAISGVDSSAPSSPQTIAAPFTLTLGQKIWARASIIRKDARVSNKFSAPSFIVGGYLNTYGCECDPAPVPDCQCNYIIGGAFNGKIFYKREVPGFYLWWDGVDTWNISEVLGTPGAEFWTLTQASPVGVYTLGGTATGAPEVSTLVHVP